MKNLKLYSEHMFTIELQSEEESLMLSAIDIEHNRIFFASSAAVVYALDLNPPQKEKYWSKTSPAAEVGFIDIEPGDCIKALDYLMEKEALIVGTSSGYLLLYNADENTTEVVGNVDGGVKSIAPSPDGALLAVSAGFGQILVMTQDWEVLHETVLETLETDIAIDSGNLTCSPDTVFETYISWRGDGKYYATLSRQQSSSSNQKLRIWERESGTLHASSESKSFMGASLDWMPSGAKVVASYDGKAEGKCPSIVFFERNGLERSSFTIEEPMEASVEIVKWNCTSDLLAALVKSDRYDAIKIWSFSNNHWYLKQEFRYPKKDEVKFIWDPIKPLHLICWTVGGKVFSDYLTWVTAVTENSTAFVVDNCKILVSPLSLSLMPPPMSLFNLKFSSSVQNFAFFLKNSSPLLAFGLSDGSLCVVELPVIDTWEAMEGKDLCIEPSDYALSFGTLSHLTWLDSHTLLGVSHSEASHGFSLLELDLVCSESSDPGFVTFSGWHVKVSKCLSLEGPVIGIVPNPVNKGSAYIQFDGGSVFEYSSKVGITGGSTEPYLKKLDYDFGFSSSCPWMNVVPVGDNEILKPLVFGLDDNGRLQVRGKILCHNCNSFSFYSNTVGISQRAITHLILTTKQDAMFIISINDILNGNPEVNPEKFVPGNIKKRQEENGDLTIWERGAKLVGVIHGDEAAVILQTNRGSLECIYPRKLVLFSIVNALVQRRFKDAMLMIRRHRIDFNVIVDHCGWQYFLQRVPEFIRQVNNLSHITDFICSIKNEDVMHTLYKNVASLPGREDPKNVGTFAEAHTKSKVSSVLQAIKTALEEHVAESPARELCILTTLARSDPPALEEALKRIKVIREKELLGVDNARRALYPSAEDAVKHLLWLSDSDAVYEAALGLYDLNIAAIVALNSQKDPKEFLPFLQGLECMPAPLMKYKIDLRLQRYKNALEHIFSVGEAYYEDCMNLMKTNPQLFPLGLTLFSDGPKRVQVLESWGDHLYGEKCFDDAATNYLCCSSLHNAMKAYRACGNWRSVFSVGGLLKLGREEVLQLANELCEELNALGKPAEAAKVALEYCGDVSGGVGYFVSAREWEEALRVGLMHGRDDLVNELKSAAIECASTLLSEYEEGKEKVGKYLARYLAVRQRRLLLKAKLESEERAINDVDDDSISETSSNFSGMSAYTTGTTKGSGASVSSSMISKAKDKRHQRKKGGKIRAGSPGEEMALVDHLKGLSLTAGALRELKSLVLALVMLNEEDIARKLQRVGTSFQMSQLAAVQLAEDTISNENIEVNVLNLEHYIQKVNSELLNSELFSWQSKVLLSHS